MRRVSMLCVLLLLLGPSRVHADTLYDLEGTLQDGAGTFTGTIVYLPQYQDVGRVTGTVTDGAYSFTIPSYLGETLDYGGVTHVDLFSVGLKYDLYLNIPNDILTGGVGGALCSLSAPCLGGFGPSYFRDVPLTGNGELAFQTLTLLPQSTPEPSSLLLLGTGMLGIAASMRRRFLPGQR